MVLVIVMAVLEPDRNTKVPAGAVQQTLLFCSKLCVPVPVTPVEVRDHVDCATEHEMIMLVMYVRSPTPGAAISVPEVPAPEMVTVVRSGLDPTQEVTTVVDICAAVGILFPTAAVIAVVHEAWALTVAAIAAADGSALQVVCRVDSAELVASPDWICATDGMAAPAAAVRAAAHAACAPTAVATAAAEGRAEHVVWSVDNADAEARPDWFCATDGIAAPAAAVSAAAQAA